MSNWWVRVYTIPALKKYVIPLLFWGIANILNAYYIPSVRELCFVVAIYPIFVFFNTNIENASHNFEFHMNHMRGRDFATILFYDLSIQVFTFILSFLVLGHLPWLNESSRIFLFDMLGTPSTSCLWLVLGLLAIFFTKVKILKRRQEISSQILEGKETRLKRWFIFLFFSFIIFSLYSYSISFYLVVNVSFTFLFVTSFIEWYWESFRLHQSTLKWKYVIIFSVLSLQMMSLRLLSQNAKIEISQNRYSLEQRIQSFAFYKNFNLNPSLKTVSEILESPFSNPIAKDIFNQAADEVFLAHVDEVIKVPDFDIYSAYMSSSRVSKENLKIIFEKFKSDSSEWQSQHSLKRFRSTLASLLPEEKNQLERLPAKSEGEIK